MIAVISSTIAPSILPCHEGARTTLSPEQRLEQTKESVASLVKLGATEIFIADNSPSDWVSSHVTELAPAKVRSFRQPPLRNRGLGELWLLLSLLEELPDGVPIIKLSGRYCVGADTNMLPLAAAVDVVGRVRGGSLSTRSYLLRDKQVAGRLWAQTMEEMFAHQSRIVGPRSLLNLVRYSLFPKQDPVLHSDPTLSVEQAILKAIRHLDLRLHAVQHLGVTGKLGNWENNLIQE